ncbi:hypothetical protein E3P99_01049 [Wallemia hederae]|uniref:RRM domain-containing protein n=1 Tax=Wallemia hederae TaxID=1540922 RepID=A0A4T0FS14_9BASI|nr:hypothetical protein E3P99_01049 [Wallemia hederae]
MLSKFKYKLTNIPYTATTSDVKRLVARSAKLNPLSADRNFDVSFRSSKFPNTPNMAFVDFTNIKAGENFQHSVRIIDTLILSTSQVKCTQLSKSKEEDTMSYYKPTTHPGQVAILSGLPGRLTQFDIQKWLGAYHIDHSANSSDPITSLRIPSDKFTGTTKWLVRLNSTSEAHRLVRNINQSSWDGQYTVNARIIY